MADNSTFFSPLLSSSSWCKDVAQRVEIIWNRRVEYWAIRSSAPLHRSLIRLLRTTRFARALHCAHSFARSLAHSLAPELIRQWVFVCETNISISYSINPLCGGWTSKQTCGQRTDMISFEDARTELELGNVGGWKNSRCQVLSNSD